MKPSEFAQKIVKIRPTKKGVLSITEQVIQKSFFELVADKKLERMVAAAGVTVQENQRLTRRILCLSPIASPTVPEGY